jgi:hypothetical protein
MKGPKILAGCGCALVLLCGASLLVFVALPVVTEGRASQNEVMPGIMISGGCGCAALIPFVAGLIWWMVAGKKPRN